MENLLDSMITYSCYKLEIFIDAVVNYLYIRPLLCENLFSVVSFFNVVMRNVGVIRYWNVLLTVLKVLLEPFLSALR